MHNTFDFGLPSSAEPSNGNLQVHPRRNHISPFTFLNHLPVDFVHYHQLYTMYYFKIGHLNLYMYHQHLNLDVDNGELHDCVTMGDYETESYFKFYALFSILYWEKRKS